MEIDKQIHEMIHGNCDHEWVKESQLKDGIIKACPKCKTRYVGEFIQVPPYSTDIADAFLVVEWLREKGYEIQTGTDRDNPDGVWNFCFYEHPADLSLGSAFAETLPLAICQAALKLGEKGP